VEKQFDEYDSETEFNNIYNKQKELILKEEPIA